jgi:hypothetical protein
MDSRIGSSRYRKAERFIVIVNGNTEHLVQGSFKFALYSAKIRLFRPTVKFGTVISQIYS